MKKINIQLALFTLIASSIFCVANIANAGDASLYISPASKTVNVGDDISGTVGINAGGNKIYAVEGTLVFDGLTCQSIAVAENDTKYMWISKPTCANTHFSWGIQGGSDANMALFTISAKAATVGTATISMTGVKIVGGDSIKIISTTGGSGSYTINPLVKIPEVVVEPPKETTPIEPSKTAKPLTKSAIVKPAEVVPVETSTEIVSTTATATEPEVNGKVLAGFEQAESSTQAENDLFGSNTVKVIAIIILVVAVLLGLKFYLGRKKK